MSKQDLLDPSEIGTAKRSKTPKAVKESRNWSVIRISGIFGLLVFTVCLSILYMAYMVIFGTDDMISKYMTIPALLFVGYFFVVKAAK
jgi:hypothetical protein